MPRTSKSKKEKQNQLPPEQIINLPASQRREHFKKFDINDDLLVTLLERHKKEDRVSEILGEIYIAVVDKVAGMPSWRSYSEDWMDEFKGRAMEHLCKYGHNFKKEKSKRDATNYLIQVCWRAFQQSLKMCKANHEKEGIELNQEIDTELGYESL